MEKEIFEKGKVWGFFASAVTSDVVWDKRCGGGYGPSVHVAARAKAECEKNGWLHLFVLF